MQQNRDGIVFLAQQKTRWQRVARKTEAWHIFKRIPNQENIWLNYGQHSRSLECSLNSLQTKQLANFAPTIQEASHIYLCCLYFQADGGGVVAEERSVVHIAKMGYTAAKRHEVADIWVELPQISLLKYSIQVPQITMLDFLFSCLVGTGIGAYNSASIKPCLSDTVKMIKQKPTVPPFALVFSLRPNEPSIAAFAGWSIRPGRSASLNRSQWTMVPDDTPTSHRPSRRRTEQSITRNRSQISLSSAMASVQKEATPCSDPPVLSLSVPEATAQQGQTALGQGVPVNLSGHLHGEAQRQTLPAVAPRKAGHMLLKQSQVCQALLHCAALPLKMSMELQGLWLIRLCTWWTDPETLCCLTAAAKGLQKESDSDEHWKILACNLVVRPLADTEPAPFTDLFPTTGLMEDAMKTKVLQVYFPVFQVRRAFADFGRALKHCGKKCCLKAWRACCKE
eukprot:s363_g7.t1